MTTQAQTADLDDDYDVEAEPEAQPSLLLRVGTELVGTFLLVTAIIVVAAFGAVGASATVLYVALAGGLALTALVAAFGSVSGAHLNPAVSLGAAIAGRLSWVDLAPYVVAQTLGAVGAGALLRALIPAGMPAALGLSDVREVVSTTANGFGVHSPIANLSNGQVTFSTMQALLIEAVATAMLVGVVLAVTKRPTPAAPLAIGGSLTVAILVAGQVTNAAINPARATASAFFAESWAMSQLWLFWVAPLIGAAIAGLVVLAVRPEPVAEYDDDDYDDDEDEDDEDDEDEADDDTEPVAVEGSSDPEVAEPQAADPDTAEDDDSDSTDQRSSDPEPERLP